MQDIDQKTDAPLRATLSQWRAATMARRRYQRGSLVDDGDRWIGRWREDIEQPDGTIKRKHRSEIFASKKDYPTKRLAQRLLDEKLREINHEDYRPSPAMRFEKFAQRWMEIVLVQQKRSTQRSEKSRIQVHLIPAFRGLELREMTAQMMQAWVSSQTAVSPKTIRNMVMTLRTMWTTAKAWGYVRIDPFEGLKLPAVPKGNTYTFTPEETLAIINAAQGWKKLFFRILAEAGMRPGELAGLGRNGVKGRVLEISQSVWQREIQTVKTSTAVRRFAISTSLAAALDRYMAATPANAYGLLFVAESGRPLSMDNFRHRTLNPILEKLGIRQKTGKRIGNYAFRHFNATRMDVWGVPLKTRQGRMGHADPTTTLIHYTESLNEEDFRVADMFGAMFDEKGGAVQ